MLGPVDGYEGLFLATGGSGHCFKLGAGDRRARRGRVIGKPLRLRRRRRRSRSRASPRAASSDRATAGTAREPRACGSRNRPGRAPARRGGDRDRRARDPERHGPRRHRRRAVAGDVAIEDGRIAAVGASTPADAPGDRRRRARRRARVHRHPQPLRLHAARRPAARERDPPGRDARGRRQLRLRLLPDPRPASSRARRSTATATTCRSSGATAGGYFERLERGAAGGQRAQPRAERPAAARRPSASPTAPADAAELARDAGAAARVARRGRVGLLDRARVRAGVGRDRGGDHRALLARSTRQPLRDAHAHAATRAQFESVEEAIRAAERAEARLQVSHLVPRNGIEEARRSIELVERRPRPRPRRRVRHAHAPLRPHAPLRRAAAVGARRGRRSPRCCATRRRATRMRAAPQHPQRRATTGARIVLLDNPFWPRVRAPRPRRRSPPSAARSRSTRSTTCSLGGVEAPHRLMVIIHAYTEEEQREAFAHPLCVPGSDATTLAPDGPLAELVRSTAPTRGPRGSGASWSATQRLLAPGGGRAQADRRSRPRGSGSRDRGVLREGARADVAVFDPADVRRARDDVRAEPAREGMRHVLVNGVPTLRDGQPTGRRGGDGAAAMTGTRPAPMIAQWCGGMKALVWHGGRELTLEDLAEPEPPADEVVLDVRAAPGSAAPTCTAYRGHPGPRVPPLVLGHEVVGPRRRRHLRRLSAARLRRVRALPRRARTTSAPRGG